MTLRRQVEQATKQTPAKLGQIETQLLRFAEELSEVRQVSHGISDTEQDKLVETLRRSIEERAQDDVLENIRNSVRDSVEREESELELRSRFEATLERLSAELAALTGRGNLNLSLGIITALAGIGLLGVFVLGQDAGATTTVAFTENFLPRISLVILVEIFAYFFLKLYSTSLREIKYFQNEMTNIDSKYLALRAAAAINNEDATAEVISQLAQTDRNYIPEKGQTTVDLERSKLEK